MPAQHPPSQSCCPEPLVLHTLSGCASISTPSGPGHNLHQGQRPESRDGRWAPDVTPRPRDRGRNLVGPGNAGVPEGPINWLLLRLLAGGRAARGQLWGWEPSEGSLCGGSGYRKHLQTVPDSHRQPGGSKESGQERKKQGEEPCACRPASKAGGSIRVRSEDTDREAQGLGNNGSWSSLGQLVQGEPSAAEAVCLPAQALPPTMMLPGYSGVCPPT